MKARHIPHPRTSMTALVCAAIISLAAPVRAQQLPPPGTPVPPTVSSSSTGNKIAAAVFLGGALAAWWADARVDKVVREMEEKLRKTHTDSNGDVTVTQKDGKGRVLEIIKNDKHGDEKDYEKRRWIGEICVYEEHRERQTDGGLVHHIIRRDKDGNVIDDERNVFDKDGRHVAGTHTTVDADGKSSTKTYDKDTNAWK